MPTCQTCAIRWTWFETLKRSSFALGGKMTCPYCNNVQYVSAQSRKRNSLFSFLIIIPFFMNLFFDLSFMTVVIIAVIIGLVAIGINPLFMTLANEEEPLF